jgi:hypothetical protein
MTELRQGIPASEMREHIETIRGERRSATPARKVKEKIEKVAKAKAKSEPIDILSFLEEEHGGESEKDGIEQTQAPIDDGYEKTDD